MKNRSIADIILFVIITAVIISVGFYFFQRHKELTGGKDNEADIGAYEQELADLNEAYYHYYIQKQDEDILFLSAYGYLYNDTEKINIEVTDLESDGFLTATDTMKQAALNYLKYSDVLAFANSEDNSDTAQEDALELFVSLPVDDSVIISSLSHDTVVMPINSYKDLLMKYACGHGSIVNPKDGSAELNSILAAVTDASGIENIDIKHIAHDDLYACTVIGSNDNPADIREYILKKDNDGRFTIIMDGLEKAEIAKKTVNEAFPDFETGLMPIYNIADFGEIRSDLGEFFDSLKQQKLIDSSNTLVYSCGADGFVYFESQTKKLVGIVNADNELNFHEVESPTAAITYMLSMSQNPPVFIIKMNGLMTQPS